MSFISKREYLKASGIRFQAPTWNLRFGIEAKPSSLKAILNLGLI